MSASYYFLPMCFASNNVSYEEHVSPGGSQRYLVYQSTLDTLPHLLPKEA